MSDENKKDEPKVQADNNSIAVGNISASGNIGDVNITTGYTVEQVSVLITQIQSTFQTKPFDGRCPYKGLNVFEEEDAELFFGREKLVDDLVSRVKDSRTVFITGPSGSGKSSLVRAGLIHALKQGAIKGGDRWLYATMKPGRDPIGELGRVVSSLASSTNPEDEIRAKAIKDATIFARWCEIALKEGRDKRLVLFIDQFEEVFTQISNETERVAFLNLLTHAATIENGRVIILFSMRSDFVSNCATYPQINSLLNQQFVQIGAMQPEELVSAIAQPALRVGLRIDPDLIAQIINEMKGEPGALPLMQFALKDLFDSQQEKSGVIALTLNDYLQRGGIHKALERHADDSFSKLNKHEQELARSIFSGLIEIGRGTQDTKRTALFDELVPANAKATDVEAIVQKLADARLITTDEAAGRNTVTISHEKLIDAWPWLKKLVNENRDVIALQNEISTDAKEWDDHKRDSSYLYSGARLDFAREQLPAQKIALNELANEFIDEGINIRYVERKTKELLRKRIVLGLISGMVIALVFAGFAIYQMIQAQNHAKTSRAGELAGLAISEKDGRFDHALLFSVEAINTQKNDRTEGTLLNLMNSHSKLEGYLSGHSGTISCVAFSPDGRLLASGSWDKSIILWDFSDPTKPSKLFTLLGHNDYVVSITFSPDGKTLASGDRNNTIILWDIRHKSNPSKLAIISGNSTDDFLKNNYTQVVQNVNFSPDGKTLASISGSDKIVLWNISNLNNPVNIASLSGHKSWIFNIVFSPDGKRLASGSVDKTIILWDINNLSNPIKSEVLLGHASGILGLAFSPNGKILASGSSDRAIILWDVSKSNSSTKLTTLTGHSDYVVSLAFSPDGERLSSGSRDKTVILWDMRDVSKVSRLDTLMGHASRVNSVAFSPDGKRLASGSNNNIIMWNLTNSNRPSNPTTLIQVPNSVNAIAFSPVAKILASGSSDGSIILWDVTNSTYPSKLATLSGHNNEAYSLSFSPDGKILASGSRDLTIILWDVRNPSNPFKITTLTGHTDSVNSIIFSPDGKILASGSRDGSIILWDVSRPIYSSKMNTLSRGSAWIESLSISSDNKILASGNSNGEIVLWDLVSGEFIGHTTAESNIVYVVVFSPDGKKMASGYSNGTVILWDMINPTNPTKIKTLSGHSDYVLGLDFSPDSKRLASGSFDNTIIYWDVNNPNDPTRIATLSGHNDYVWSVAFRKDGKELASGSADKTIILWDLDTQSLIEKACQQIGRNFTRAEWRQYFPGEEYRATCPQWPLDLIIAPTTIP